ncbi:unnamed protein product, partial [Discosporangium mesarthrocarpum]
ARKTHHAATEEGRRPATLARTVRFRSKASREARLDMQDRDESWARLRTDSVYWPEASTIIRPRSPVSSFDDHMIPYAAVPMKGMAVSAKLLTFRLKNTGPKSRAASKKSRLDDRAGYVHVLAIVYADGMVHFHDAQGEKVLDHHSGHSVRARVVALSGNSAEDPLLVTAASDGTVHAHSLTVWYKGRRLASPRRPRSQAVEAGEGAGGRAGTGKGTGAAGASNEGKQE